MKKLLILICLTVLLVPLMNGQTVPQGMKYQAVARDLSGEVMANQQVFLKIQLQSNIDSPMIHYIEVHTTTTNQFGLFSLVIGEGIVERGVFNDVPWGTEDIWMGIAIKDINGGDFKTISNSKLLAVPYAFHALTANELITERGPGNGVPAQVWSLFGNSNSNSEDDKLGTTDYVDLVMITDNLERLRITKDGDINIENNLDVGNNLYVHNDTFLDNNVEMNITGGETINHGDFTVEDMSSTLLTGTLTVEKETDLKNDLNVDGITNLNEALNVNNEKKTSLTGELEVDGKLTLNNNLEVVNDDENFIATFTNTNNTNGDGIKIKLGRKAAKNHGVLIDIDEAFKTLVSNNFSVEDEIDMIKSLLSYEGEDDRAALFEELLNNSPLGTQDEIAATGCNMAKATGKIIKNILNSSTGIPDDGWKIELEVGIEPFNRVQELGGGDNIKVMKHLEFDNPSCEIIEAVGFELSFPNLKGLEDLVDGLDSENSFITFTDNEDFQMGAIKAQSIEDWVFQYLDPVFLYNLLSTFAGLDIVEVLPELIPLGLEVGYSYLDIGVEYSSGNGDYAEWLERLDPKEVISAGDIVAVKAGKITKDLTNAEQVMGVSYRPIVLGNIPKEGKTNLGNNVAFMGQIPVKIMGPVATGDYIVGKSKVPGYGIAIHPKDMTLEDFKITVGRSWDSNPDVGAKMVNTVVGVHNGDYLNILKQYEKKFKDSENRFETLEAKIENLEELILIDKASN